MTRHRWAEGRTPDISYCLECGTSFSSNSWEHDLEDPALDIEDVGILPTCEEESVRLTMES